MNLLSEETASLNRQTGPRVLTGLFGIGFLTHSACLVGLLSGFCTSGGVAMPCHGPPTHYLTTKLSAILLAIIVLGPVVAGKSRWPARQLGLLGLLSVGGAAALTGAPLLLAVGASALAKASQGYPIVLFSLGVSRALSRGPACPLCDPD